MEVRIRRSTETLARHLTNSTLDRTDRILSEARKWLSGDDKDRELTGQLIAGEEGGAAYFEIVIDDEDDGYFEVDDA